MSALLPNIVRFAGLLRARGLDVHSGRIADVVTVMQDVGVRERENVRAALSCLMVHRREDLPTFDAAFDVFWRALEKSGEGPALFSLGERPRLKANPAAGVQIEFDSDAADSTAAAAPRLAAAAWSALESLKTRDFGDLSPAELMRAEALLASLPWALGIRRTRRWVRASHGRIDLRPIVRANMKHGGELLELPRRARRQKPRPIVVIADVSGSMERYARMLLHFVCGVSAGMREVESFVFATRITRITRLIARRGATGALTPVAREVRDWGGGTRIGEALRAFNVQWARRVMRHGPVVLIVSDGWDRGDPDLLARELAHVRRSCHRLVWLNPLLGSATYEPLTRGMRAALPLVDDFLPSHNLDSLERLADHLASLSSQRRAH